MRIFLTAILLWPPEEYFDILSYHSSKFDIWETVYYHNMPSFSALLDWVRGTKLRPFLNALSKQNQILFLDEVSKRAKEFYTPAKNGNIIFKFKRLFFTAEK
ncbi:MAG: hypothetical protein LUG21_04405 [Clostridiales bacterium]|nr:hypothetical protein [Clostridiales bacterium]